MSRTLVITNDFPPNQGGIESYVHELVSRMDPAALVVFASRAPGDRAYDLTLPYKVIRASGRTLLPSPTVRHRAIDIIRKEKIDAVWYPSSVPMGLLAPSIWRHTDVKRQIATTHAHEVWWAKVIGLRHALHRVGQSVDHMTYITEFTRGAIEPALSQEASQRMVHLSPAVSDGQFQFDADPGPVLDRYGLARRPMVLCVGRLVPRKGQDILLQAMPQVLAGHPEAVLVIVGKGDYADHLKRLAWRLGLTDAVIFTGGVPQAILPSFYAAASLFAGPSRSRYGGLEVEGFGIVYLEAQASGLPVVVGRSGGSPEALQDGRTGLLVDGTDPAAVASAINQLLADPIMAKAMGQAGRAWVQSKWTWDSRAALLQELLAV